METPCPPYFAKPTHQQTLVFSTLSFVRNYNDWYQCIEGAYCNTPPFFGYNPPGEGAKWETAWRRLDVPYPCNTALEESSNGGSPTGGGFGSISKDTSLTLNTKRPTNEPTRRDEMPSLISGVVWYDYNGDGRENTAINALSQVDYNSAQRERGAGVSNMKVTLRECGTDRLLGVAYTFPISFGRVGEGLVEVIDASYIESIQLQEMDSIGYNVGNDGLGIGNTEGRLGYYSFRVLPFQIPGQFYVAFESPEGYRLSGGSGNYWEVYKAAMNDDVQPMMDAPWRSENTANRRLQTNTTAAGNNATNTTQETQSNPDERPNGPINYSGYFAKSRCISFKEVPSEATNINAGLTTVDSWPLTPHQYGSLVVTVLFYVPTNARGRSLQINVDSLECRKYQKLKSEGVEVEDIWGCEMGAPGGAASVKASDFQELTLPEADLVANSINVFLSSRIPRAWTVKFVSLAHQEMKVFVEEEGRVRGLLDSLYSLFVTNNGRGLQANKLAAKLEMGLRVRAEYVTDKSDTDLSDVVASSIRNGPDNFLTAVKSANPMYFKLAGGVEVRDKLWTADEETAKEEEKDTVDKEKEDPLFENIPENAKIENNKILGMSMGMFIGIIAGSVAFIAIVIGLLIFRRRSRKYGGSGSSRENSSGESSQNKASDGKKKWGQKKTKEKTNIETKKVVSQKNRGRDEESEFSSDIEDDSFDDLSSRFYSDSSKYDPELRRRELDAFGGVGGGSLLGKISSDGDSYETGSRSEMYSQSDGDSYMSYETDGSRSYSYASSASGRPPRTNPRGSMRSSFTSGRLSRESHNPRSSMRSGQASRSSMRSSGRTNRSSMRSSGRMSSQASDLYSEASSSRWMSKISEDDYSASRDSQSTKESGPHGRPRRS